MSEYHDNFKNRVSKVLFMIIIIFYLGDNENFLNHNHQQE